MDQRMSVMAFSIPGHDAPDEAYQDDEAGQAMQTQPYSIPPVVWMISFLLIGYVGLRMLLED